ncbi:MAG: hypothetical protein QOI41_4458 [Myxococcales bacterium]|nr:hypothetical protein [Myxococcales bacterium]
MTMTAMVPAAAMTPTFTQKLHDLLGSWGRPPDEVAKVAAALALVALLCVVTGRGRSLLGVGPTPLPRHLFLWITSFIAALLSIFYVAFYLRGGPRIIDATTYFLQGRALSHGDIAWPVLEPSGSFRGRFLLYRELSGGGGGGAGEGLMAGIFPPGYPILLAIGFGMGAPMVIGPAIAAALVIATYRLARTIAEDVPGTSSETAESIARTAALLSIVCGALRYHTADTMSHGATALGIALALDAALRRRAVVAGLVVGAVVATRPVSALAVGVVALAMLVRAGPAGAGGRERTNVVVRRFVLATLPGILVLVLAQHAATGAWFASSQRVYYATSDGPPGCFGAGASAGCLYEHGEFVAARLANGFGIVAAAGTTLRRLRMHLLDVANLEPLALLVLVPLARVRGAAKRSPAVLAAFAVIVLHVLAYAPFYFDGNYPGGGARLFADLLPIEHALVAIAVARLVSAPRYLRAAFALLAFALAGFAVHASFDHVKLADRDGGRPMFEPDLLARSNIATGLVFVDTDHGFALGFDPEARIKSGVVVARLHNDDRDRILFDQLDHPPTFLYKFDIPQPGAPAVPGGPPPTQAVPVVVPWAPPASADSLRFEAEADWPVLAQSGGLAVPVFADSCASGSRGLMLVPTPVTGRARATLTVPVPQAGRYSISVRIVHGTSLPFATTRGPRLPEGALTIEKERWEWTDVPTARGFACADLALHEADLTPPAAHFVLEAAGGGVTVDRILLKRLP